MITAEPWAQTQERRKRLEVDYPELAHSTPSQIAEVDGAYPDRLPTSFTQDQVRLANYARDASGDAEDAAPNVLPWTPSPGPLTAPEATTEAPDTAGNVIPWRPRVTAPDPYSMEALSSVPMPPSGPQPSASLGETAGRVGQALNPLNPMGVFGTAYEGDNPLYQELARPANYIPIGEGAAALRVARGVAGGIAGRLAGEAAVEALPEDANPLLKGAVGLGAGLAGGAVGIGGVSAATGGRVRTWMEAAEEAAAQSSGAAEAAVRAAQPEAFQFGRGTLTEQGALRPAAVRPDDMIPRRTLLEPEGRQVGAQAGGAELPQQETLAALRERKLAEGLTPQQIMADPEVQDAMARVFAPDYNAAPADAVTASDINVNLRRAREQDARPAAVPEFPLQGGGVAGGSQEFDNPAFARLPEQPSPPRAAQVAEPLARGEAGTIPIESVRTRPELFQARDVAPGQSFDERRVQDLVSEWNPERLDPITVARDPEGGYVVTSGHHRLEAARRVGMEDIPVRVADVDLRSAAGQRTAQREAILSNFSVAEQNVRERVRAFEALAQDGMSPDEIGAAARMSADRVQRTLDIGTAGRQVVERVTQNPTLEGVAAEVGRFRRLHGLSDEDAAGTFNALVQRGKGESIPSTPSVRRMLDRLAPAFENRQLPGFEGQGFGGDATPLYEAVREGAKLQDELMSASRRISSEVGAVERLGERAGVDVSGLRATGQRELDAINEQLGTLEQSVMERVRTQAREQGGQGRLGADVPNVADNVGDLSTQEGPDLFANAGIGRMERPSLPTSDVPTGPQGRLPRQVLDIKGPEASMLKRGADFLVDIANVPRSLMASLDLSGTLRQGGWLAPRHNAEWRAAFKEQLRALGSEEAALRTQREIDTAPLAGYRPDTLYMTEWNGTDIGKREEQFASRFAGNLPGVKQTSRAYAVMLNKLRADTFDSFVAQLTPAQRTPQRLEEYAKYVNAATGRGNLPKMLETFAPTLNAAFFSPRFLASIPQRHLAAFTRDPLVRNEVLKDMAGFYGTGMTLIGSLIAAEQAGLLPGVHVETDYNSPDWGKARIGNTRIDIWGGQQQFARMMARATASTPGWLQGKNKPGDNPVNIMAQFLRYKFAPVLNTEEQLRTGTTAVGEQQGAGEAIIRNVTPLLLQELYDAYAQGGAGAAALTVPSVFGLGVSTYGDTPAASSSGRSTRPAAPPRPARPAPPPRPARPQRPARPARVN